MRWRRNALDAFRDHILRFGLRDCPVCNTENLRMSDRPTMVTIGGHHHEPDDPRRDPDANSLYAFHLECSMCGYMLLFNSERFFTGDEPILYRGPTEPED